MVPAKGEAGFTDALIDSQPNSVGDESRAAFLDWTQWHPLIAVELLKSLAASGGLQRDKPGRLIEVSA